MDSLADVVELRHSSAAGVFLGRAISGPGEGDRSAARFSMPATSSRSVPALRRRAAGAFKRFRRPHSEEYRPPGGKYFVGLPIPRPRDGGRGGCGVRAPSRFAWCGFPVLAGLAAAGRFYVRPPGTTSSKASAFQALISRDCAFLAWPGAISTALELLAAMWLALRRLCAAGF